MHHNYEDVEYVRWDRGVWMKEKVWVWMGCTVHVGTGLSLLDSS
jgi:hypothetical protein